MLYYKRNREEGDSMSYDEIKKYIYENNGIYFTKKLKEEGIDKYYINKLLSDGIIERYEPGVYLRNDIFEDELYILQQKISKYHLFL